MFAFPPNTFFGKLIPKSRIFLHAQPSRRIRDLFASQVAEIRWVHKLSPETLNLPAKPDIPEIEILEILLKGPTLDDVVLEIIDKSIPYPTIHRLSWDRMIAWSAAFKRPSESDSTKWVVGTRFTSPFAPLQASLPPVPAVLDLGHLYAALIAELLPLPARVGESIENHVARCERFRILKNEMEQIQKQVHREKQFNRKVIIKQKLNPISKEIKAVSVS